jgi:cytochrome bd-type quinol oxidase subunit 2
MAKRSSNWLAALLGRIVKAVMVAVLAPLAIGLLLGILGQLDVVAVAGTTARTWITWGFLTYLGIHLLLYRPVAMFQVNHRLFSSIARWLFGGQVASVEEAGGGRARQSRGAKDEKTDSIAQGSTLVAFSPYVVPLYLVLICAAGWALRQWDRVPASAVVSFLIGVAVAFHWLMTADDLQRQRDRWSLEAYLLAIGLIFVVTLLLGAACLPLAVPEFSFAGALDDGFSRAQGMYAALIQELFL